MKHLRLFKTNADYETFKTSGELVFPNVSFIKNTDLVEYYSVPPVGASIYGKDYHFYTNYQWIAAGKTSDDAIGVVVSDGVHSFVIHPTEERYGLQWSTEQVLIEGGYVTKTLDEAKNDFDGVNNSTALYKAVIQGTSCPAATYCIESTFYGAKHGYLMSAGELMLINENVNEINECLNLINGITFDFNNKRYWTSTQWDKTSAYGWSVITLPMGNIADLANLGKTNDSIYTRVVGTV